MEIKMTLIHEKSVHAFSIPFDTEHAKLQTDVPSNTVQFAIEEASNSFGWHNIPTNTIVRVRTNRQAQTRQGVTLQRGAGMLLEPQAAWFLE